MKARLFLLTAAIFAALLCSCASSDNSIQFVNRHGNEYQVDTEAQTVSVGRHTYQYSVTDTSTTICYPNGATYTSTRRGSSYNTSWSKDYDPVLYADGSDLCAVVSVVSNIESPSFLSPGKILAVILLAGVGIVNLVSPQVSWYLTHGWHYKNAEPSELSLSMNRIAGVILLVIAVFTFFMPIG